MVFYAVTNFMHHPLDAQNLQRLPSAIQVEEMVLKVINQQEETQGGDDMESAYIFFSNLFSLPF